MISIFANSVINFELLHTIFPSVSNINRGNGALIKLLFAAESTVNVKSCNCSDISLLLLLFANYVYPKIAKYNMIDGIIILVFRYDNITNNKNIITRYILVLDTKLSNNFLLLFSDIQKISFYTILVYF